MTSKVIYAAILIVTLVQLSYGSFINTCSCGAPISLPLPFPSSIPLGQMCHCTPIQLKPTLITPSSCQVQKPCCCQEPRPCCNPVPKPCCYEVPRPCYYPVPKPCCLQAPKPRCCQIRKPCCSLAANPCCSNVSPGLLRGLMPLIPMRPCC